MALVLYANPTSCAIAIYSTVHQSAHVCTSCMHGMYIRMYILDYYYTIYGTNQSSIMHQLLDTPYIHYYTAITSKIIRYIMFKQFNVITINY